MRIDYPIANKDLLLQLTVRAMSDNLRPEGLVLSSLVFGELLSVYTRSEIPKPRDSLGKRAKMVHTARIEMMRTSHALKHAVPAAADIAFYPGY
eukprot:IDg7113t1